MELDGISVGGRNINNIRYADDTVLIADSAEKLQTLIRALVQSSEQRGLKLNISKTKVMVVTKGNNNLRVNISVGDETLEQVENISILAA